MLILIDLQDILSFITGAVNRELVQGSRGGPGETRRAAGVLMRSTTQEVDFRYPRGQLEALFQLASAKDVEKGGRYDARSGAINIYSRREKRRKQYIRYEWWAMLTCRTN
jgi:hypothetical protein